MNLFYSNLYLPSKKEEVKKKSRELILAVWFWSSYTNNDTMKKMYLLIKIKLTVF